MYFFKTYSAGTQIIKDIHVFRKQKQKKITINPKICTHLYLRKNIKINNDWRINTNINVLSYLICSLILKSLIPRSVNYEDISV